MLTHVILPQELCIIFHIPFSHDVTPGTCRTNIYLYKFSNTLNFVKKLKYLHVNSYFIFKQYMPLTLAYHCCLRVTGGIMMKSVQVVYS